MDNRLRHAVAVARHGSFSRAAKAVGVTQSAVTKSVAELERQIGYAIFYRTSKGIITTEDGRDFIDRATRLLSDATDLLHNRREAENAFRGAVRFGVFPGSLEWMVAAGVTELVRRHPGIHIEMSTGTSERGIQLLNRGDIDAAFGMMAAFESWKEIDITRVASLVTHCFVRKDHPLLERNRIDLDDITEFKMVCSSMSAPYVDVARDLYQSRGMNPDDRIHISDYFPLVKRIVRYSDAVGVISDAAANSASEEGFVVLRDLPVFPALDLGIGVRARWPVKPAVRFLVSQLLEVLPEHPA